MGGSDRENKAQGLYNDLGNMNTSSNVFSNFSYPYSSGQQMSNLNSATTLGSQALSTQGATDVASARTAAGKSGLSRGYGGSVLTDMVKGAGEKTSANTTSALRKLQSDKLNTQSNIMTSANSQALGLASAKENEQQSNIKNLSGKYSGQEGLLSAYSGDNWFDDVLGVANTVSGFNPF
jgi:hypothetical protein